MVPTLIFLDPCGYKGLSLRLIAASIKDWGCDCIFFFNYNRIKLGITNPFVKDHMHMLFGRERSEALAKRIDYFDTLDAELTIIEEMSNALVELGGKYVLPFRFKNASGSRTSHHLIFISKNVRGYEIMKDIMAKESSAPEQGVPSLEYNPATVRYPFLFEFSRPLDDLADLLLDYFTGQTISMADVYKQHNVGRPYISKNYKDALRNLEAENKIVAFPPSSSRLKRKGVVTFADDVIITFPRKGMRNGN